MARRDPRLRDLLDRFVLVRLIKANGLDLERVAIDWDLTFSVILFSPEGTVLGRYGSRTQSEDPDGDLSLAGLRAALEGALALNERRASIAPALAHKAAPRPMAKRPELMASLGRFESKLDEKGDAVKSCLHCHQVREAIRLELRSAGTKAPEDELFPWPAPETLGFSLATDAAARVTAVEARSAAEAAGLRSGDEITEIGGAPPISIADVQWALHRAQGTSVAVVVRRGKGTMRLDLPLAEGWRRRSDLSWRGSTWDLRRMILGGLVLEDVAPAAREEAKIGATELALRVKSVGEYGDHARAKKAGFKKGDLVVAFGAAKNALSESALLGWAMNATRPGDQLQVAVRRDGAALTLTLEMR